MKHDSFDGLRAELRNLITAASHSHTALTFDVSIVTKRASSANLQAAIERADRLLASIEGALAVDVAMPAPAPAESRGAP